jgi:hypothetical protein
VASYTVAADLHGAYAKTLVANTVDTVTFTDDIDRVEVTSNGAAAVYVTVDGTTTPTVAGAGTFELPAGAASVREIAVPTAGGTVVKLISAGTPVYSVAETST